MIDRIYWIILTRKIKIIVPFFIYKLKYFEGKRGWRATKKAWHKTWNEIFGENKLTKGGGRMKLINWFKRKWYFLVFSHRKSIHGYITPEIAKKAADMLIEQQEKNK